MTPLRKIALQVCFVASFLCNGAMAAYIDFTDSTLSLSAIAGGGFEGSIDSIGFQLTSTDGTVTLNEDGGYDGSSNSHCQPAGSLKCDRDGVGIINDETTMGQTLTLIFDTAVRITSIEFLDLYIGTQTEQATVTIDGGASDSVNATGTSGDGGYANLDFLAFVGAGQSIEFTANSFFGDDGNNDYAFAAITVSAVPVPAAIWLFGTALIGFVGMSRRTKI